jgi:hypothetical protein
MAYQARKSETSLASSSWRDPNDTISAGIKLETPRVRREVNAQRTDGSEDETSHRASAGGAVARPAVSAADDVLDVKLDLYPAGTRPVSIYDKLMGPTFHVRENYDFKAPDDGSPAAFTVSRACADSIRSDSGYVHLANGIFSFRALQDVGKMDLAHRGGNRGYVAFRDLPPGKAMIVCDNEAAAEEVSPTTMKVTGTGLVSHFDYDFKPFHVDVSANDKLIDAEGYRTRAFFADGEEGYFDGGTWGRLVGGKYGFLAIHNHTFVQYVPKADPSVIGKVDVFDYKLVHPTLGTADAKVVVRIGSDQADVKWSDSNPYAEAQRVEIFDYANTATIKVKGETSIDEIPGALSYNWQAGSPTDELGVTSETYTFTVDEASKSRLTIDIYAETLPSLLDNMRIVLATDQTFPAASTDRIGIIKVGPGHLQAIAEDLSPGSYVLQVANSEPVSVPAYVDVDLTFETTLFSVDSTEAARGNVLIKEGLRSEAAEISISRDGEGYDVLGEGGTRLYGNYGTLVLQSNGDYVYEPNAEVQGIAQLDTFRYQLHLRNGTVKEGRLTIAIQMGDVEVDHSGDVPMTDAVNLEGLESAGNNVPEQNEQQEMSVSRSRRSLDLVEDASEFGDISFSAADPNELTPTGDPGAESQRSEQPSSMEGALALPDLVDRLSTIFDESLTASSLVA